MSSSPESPKAYQPLEEPARLQTSEFGTARLRTKLRLVDPVPINPEDEEAAPLLGHQPLDPGDPRVLPLNLHNVKLLKQINRTLIVVNSIVALLTFLSDFINIPGFFNPGRSFYELVIILLTVLTNAVCLWRFDVPLSYERKVGYTQAVLLSIDLVVILTVPALRDSMALLGTFLTLWLLLNVTFDAVCNYYVEQGRNYQEIRLTGRIETRRLIGELLVIFVKLVAKLSLFLLVFFILWRIWLMAFDTHERPWGDKVSVQDGQLKVHVACFGDVYNEKVAISGSDPKNSSDRQPILLIEGGQLTLSEVFQEWIEELYNLDQIERYCIWDRPGYAFSDLAPSPTLIGIVVEYLIEALDHLGVHGPFSLVGFDIGGLYLRMFALRKPGQIHLIMLVDAWSEDLLKNNPFSGPNRKNEPKKVFKNILETMNNLTGLKLWLKGMVSPLGLVQAFHWLFHPRRFSSKSRIFGSDMYWNSKYIRARLQEQLTSGILSYNEVKGADIHNLPLAVISSDFMIKNSLNWGKWQRELTKLLTNCIEWVIAENSNHFIWELPKGRKQMQELLLQLVLNRKKYDTVAESHKV